MRAQHKALYLASRKYIEPSDEYPKTREVSPSSSSGRSWSSTVVKSEPDSDLEMIDLSSLSVTFSPNYPVRFRRKLSTVFNISSSTSLKPLSSSSGSSSTVAESALNSLSNITSLHSDMSYPGPLFGSDKPLPTSTSSSTSSFDYIPVENYVEPSLPNVSVKHSSTSSSPQPHFVTSAPPPETISSSSKNSSSPSSTEQSSFSVTNAIASTSTSTSDPTFTTTEFSGTSQNASVTRGRKRNLYEVSICNSTTHRPLGPAHLEHDYSVARTALSQAIATAVYDLFGFSVPVRDSSVEARRPGKEAIPAIRAHPLVRRACAKLDKADAALEQALTRGETFENTPVPDEWRWGSEVLKPFEWAYVPPPPAPQPARRLRSEVNTELIIESRTRGQKRKATEAVNENNYDAGVKGRLSADLRSSVGVETENVALKAESRLSESPSEKRSITEDCTGDAAATKFTAIANSSVTATAAVAIATVPPSSSSSVSDSSISNLSSPIEKRKRGRPRKVAKIDASSSPGSSLSVPVSTASPKIMPKLVASRPPILSSSPSCPPLPVKRPRGRPRKHFIPMPLESVMSTVISV